MPIKKMDESKKIQMCIKNGNITCEIFKIKKKNPVKKKIK